MALRDKLAARVQPLLEPGEQVQEVALSQTGPSPYLAIITYLIFFAVKRRIIVATDRAIVIVRAGAWTGTSAKEVLAHAVGTPGKQEEDDGKGAKGSVTINIVKFSDDGGQVAPQPGTQAVSTLVVSVT